MEHSEVDTQKLNHKDATAEIQFPTLYEATINGRHVEYFDTEGDLAAMNPNYRSSKPAILLIHGWISVKEIFVTFIDELKDEYRIVAPDYPGFGRSEAIPIDSQLDAYSDFTANFIDHLGIEKIYVYGGSLGGVIASKFAAKYPERTIKVISRATPIHRSQFPLYFRVWPARVFLQQRPIINSGAFIAIFRATWHRERSTYRVLEWDYWHDKLEIRRKVLQVMFDCFEENVSFEIARVCMVYLQNMDLRDELSKNRAKGLFMVNSKDTKVKMDLELYKVVPNYTIEIFSSKAHTSLEERVDQVTRSMREYFR